jgi:predicted PurR-regulated permease PerM
VIEGLGSYRSTKRTVFLAVSGILLVALLIVSREVLLPFILALVVAYVFTPAVRRVEGKRVPRWAAILLVYAIALGVVGGFMGAVVPRLVAEGRGLATEWPRLKERIRHDWLPLIDAKLSAWSGSAPPPSANVPPSVLPAEPAGDPPADPVDEPEAPIRVTPRPDGSFDLHIAHGVQVSEVRDGVYQIKQIEPTRGLSSAAMLREGFDKGVAYLRENTVTLLRIGQQIVGAVSYGIFTLFMTLMLGGYIILTHERILDFFRNLVQPASRDSFDRFLRRLDRGLSGVVRGQLLICLVNGVLSAIGFWLFGLKYWPILSVIAGVMSIIPIFGSILSSIPAVLIGLSQSVGTAFGVLIWILGIHQLEANFLNPKIIGDSAKIHPVLVVFSLLVGEHFFQIKGALFAVPCMSIAQTIFLHFRESTLGLSDPTASVPPMSSLSLQPPSPVVIEDLQPMPQTVRAGSGEITPRSAESSAASGSDGPDDGSNRGSPA